MKKFLGVLGVVFVFGAGVHNAPVFAGEASFQGLGDLPGGSNLSQVPHVSADGLVVVGSSGSDADPAQNSTSEAFRWTQAGGMVGLGFLRPEGQLRASFANDTSFDGLVVVGSSFADRTASDPFRNEAFRWTSGGGMVGLGDLPGGLSSSGAADVSADGSVIVGAGNSASGREAFRWTSSGMVGLGDLAGGNFSSRARGVSADGAVVVGDSSSGSGINEAFRWTSGGGMVGLGVLSGGTSFNSTSYGISSDGAVVVGESSTASSFAEAYRWTSDSGMVGLGFLPGHATSIARAVSGDGSVIVGASFSGEETQIAFVWDAANGMRDLREVLVNEFGLGPALTGWTLLTARGVSDDGLTIVGHGFNPSGFNEAWIARLPSSVIQVTIDIKPGSDLNSINICAGGGVVPAAVLSTAEFDATTIDPDTARLADQAVRAVGKSGKLLAHEEDVDGDGFVDLVMQFPTVDLALTLDVTDTTALLQADTFGGDSVEGSDTVRFVKAC